MKQSQVLVRIRQQNYLARVRKHYELYYSAVLRLTSASLPRNTQRLVLLCSL